MQLLEFYTTADENSDIDRYNFIISWNPSQIYIIITFIVYLLSISLFETTKRIINWCQKYLKSNHSSILSLYRVRVGSGMESMCQSLTSSF